MTRGVMYGLTAAALFGASTPFAKTILNDVHPIVLAGLLYAGSGLGLIAVHTVRVAFGQKATAIALPSHRDWGWLAVAIVVGGILGPVLLMFGLAATAASTTSLLLNLESAFTALLAWFLFRENFDRRIAAGMAAIPRRGHRTVRRAGKHRRRFTGRRRVPLLGARQQPDTQGLGQRPHS